MSTAYLLRHGATEANERRAYCGSADLPLSAAGRAQLGSLRAAGGYPAAGGLWIYTSGLRRTEETLEILFGQVPHRIVPGLREMDFGAFEGHTYAELEEDPDYRAWLSGENEKNRCPGGESGSEMTCRVLAAFRALVPSGDFLAVTHGGPIAAVMADLFPAEGRNRYEWQPECGCGYRIVLTDSRAVSWEKVPFAGAGRTGPDGRGSVRSAEGRG